MPEERLATEPVETSETISASRTGAQRVVKVALLLASIAFCLLAFLALDWLHTTRTLRIRSSGVKPAAGFRVHGPCDVRDPVRYQAFKPNCSSTDSWGADSYEFVTNSLGFRDEKIRDIPPNDPRPRILLLGDSFTEGKLVWRDSFVGRIAGHFPQYDFLNGGASNYSPSNYLNTARMVLDKGIAVDEVVVFLDNSAVQLEAAFYRDLDASGAVTGLGLEHHHPATSWYVRLRNWVSRHFALTAQLFRLFDWMQRPLVRLGFYHLPANYFGDPFDFEMSAWTYRPVNQSDAYPAGYAPLEVNGGIAKEEAKMTLLWQELAKRNIPLSIVIYPHLGQLVHDTPDNRQVQIWQTWCEGKCKRFITVLPAFFAVKQQCPRTAPGCWYTAYFVFGDNHYNAAGNALVADAVIQSFAGEPPVKLGSGK